MMRPFAVSVVLLCWSFTASAQDDILIYGTVKDHISDEALRDARVVIASEAGILDTLDTDTAGSYSINVDYDHLWRLWYEAPSRVTKQVVVDARGISLEDREGGHGMDIEMTLFIAEPGKDYSILKEPMSIARYVDSTGEIGWDMAMLERMRQRIAPLLPDTTKIANTPASSENEVEPESGTEISLEAVMWSIGLIAFLSWVIWWFFLRRKY